MFSYLLFGGVLHTEIEIPELTPASSARDVQWTLRCGPLAALSGQGGLLGSDAVTAQVRVRLYRSPAGLRLVLDDTGCFEISADGSTIIWDRPEGASLRDARADLTGRVLAAALHAQGTLCLHGSAVALGGAAVGLVAPKRHGKSTLALALVNAGARLLTDDTLAVDMGDPIVARPGVHTARLWSDSAQRVALGIPRQTSTGEKVVYSSLPAHSISHERAPLATLYVLAPTRTLPDGAAVQRTRLSAVESAVAIIGHTKLGPLLGGSEAPAILRAAARLARQVPVYRLSIVRDLDRLDEVVEAVRSWHVPTTHPQRAALV